MISRKATIRNKLGLHARAASLFVKKAKGFASSIQVQKMTKTANGKSIMSMLMLEASLGTELELHVEGADEKEAILSLVECIELGFGEDE
ncbi:MAG: HPr family phosphocarrier protein [Gammaproteobacteria bacterium]|nr:HPr family phosphocarrier protein [Gammaproteobacteria bacterium]